MDFLFSGGINLKNIFRKLRGKVNSIGRLRLFLIIIFGSVFLSSLIYLVSYAVNAYSNIQEMKKIAPISSGSTNVQAHGAQGGIGQKAELEEELKEKKSIVSQKPSILPQFQNLYKENQDVIGWIKIDGTNVNYPVMFTPNDGEYYLHRNLQKKQEDRGLPFLDAGTDIFKSSNYIIYGHNMKDGTGFAGLNGYRTKDFYEKHPIIHFDTIYETGDYKIIGVILSKVYNQNENVFKYYKFSYPATDEQYEDFVANIKKNSIYDTGVTAYPGEQLLTLSTCSYHTQNGRLAVIAKKID